MSSSVNADARANTHSRMKYDGNESSLPVAALHAFERRRNSGMLVKKIRMMPTSAFRRRSKKTNGRHKQNRVPRSQAQFASLSLFAAIQARKGHHGTAALHIIFHEQPCADTLHPDKALSFFALLERRAAIVGESDHTLCRSNRRAEHAAVGATHRGICLFTFDAQCPVLAPFRRGESTNRSSPLSS